MIILNQTSRPIFFLIEYIGLLVEINICSFNIDIDSEFSIKIIFWINFSFAVISVTETTPTDFCSDFLI